MKCHACAHDNADRALFCAACRRPLVAPSKLPTRLEAAPMPSAAAATAGGPQVEVLPGGIVVDRTPRERYAPPNADAPGRTSDQNGLTNDEMLAAVVGDSGAHHYLRSFERIARGEGGGWNWPATFITWWWLLYRKMWLGALLYFLFSAFVPSFLAGVAFAISPTFGLVAVLSLFVGLFIVPGMYANRWYRGHCLGKIRDVRARGGSKEQVIARLEAAGGTSYVWLAVVVVVGFIPVTGILAAVALPAYQTYTVKAKVLEAMQVGNEVALTVGKQYEQSGVLPMNSDVERILSGAQHQSRYVRNISIDPSNGVLTVNVVATPTVQGSFDLVPNADSARHVTWSCTTADLKRYVPASCRPQEEPAH